MATLPKRHYLDFVLKDLKKKMVFIGGPRQVGKTTLAQSLLINDREASAAYLNWDNILDRKTILNSSWPKQSPLIVFDEIHKRKGWQSLVKGFYDTWKGVQNFVITGSARLDLYRKGGDSLLGRYHYHRIHPFSLPELGNNETNLKTLFKFGGFPEPLIDQDEVELRRWHLQRVSKLVRQDLRDLENVSDLDKVEVLADSLQSRVGSLLSIKSIAEDLEVADKTAKRWIQILDTLYYSYQISPYGSKKIKATKKAQKLYLWDWSQVENPGARFENMVASHLLKFCHHCEDTQGIKTELRFLRDDTGKECDFVVIQSGNPVFAVECKLNDTNLSPNIQYLKERVKIPKWYQVHMSGETRVIAPDLIILPFSDFCRNVGLV